MKEYTFKLSDTGYIGKAFEMAIKDVLRRSHPDRVSPAGETDFRYLRKCYDIKQNGTVIQYRPDEKYIKGSTKVIYASHVSYIVVRKTTEEITISIDLLNTDLFCVNRDEFVDFLLNEKGLAKLNKTREQVNIQTGYNYTKKAYHGRVGKRIESWAYEHESDDDDIISAILNACD